MNPRDVLTFLKTPTGTFVCFCALLVLAFVFVKGFKPKPAAAPTPLPAAKKETKPQVIQTIMREMVPFHRPPPSPTSSRPGQSTNAAKSERTEHKAELTPISLYAEAVEPKPKPLGKLFAPYGRLIPCELIVTVDSSAIRTPIIGLITEDIFHDGRLIIPAGTEVHSTAQVDRSRERIASAGEWTLVWHTGEELRLQGVALDREKDSTGDGWGITDGSAGLRGRILKSDDLAEIKLFAATFLSGAASALTEKTPTVFGPQVSPSLQNAPLKGAQDVLATYAKQILDTIQRDGFYVRVPAGKEFYLYVTQTIDKSNAAIGGTRVTAETNQTSHVTGESQAPRSHSADFPEPQPTQP